MNKFAIDTKNMTCFPFDNTDVIPEKLRKQIEDEIRDDLYKEIKEEIEEQIINDIQLGLNNLFSDLDVRDYR